MDRGTLADWVLARDRSKGTTVQYGYNVRVFQLFCFRRQQPFFPADVATVGSFLKGLISAGRKFSTVDGYIAAISRMYKFSYFPNPTRDPVIRSLSEVAKRVSGDSIRKIPVTVGNLLQLSLEVDMYNFCSVRDHFTHCLMFKGFLRSDSAVLLKGTDVWLDCFEGLTVLFVFVEKSKNDQFRRGHTLVIGPGQDASCCPLVWFRYYFLMRDSNAIALLHKGNSAPDRLTAFMNSTTVNSNFKKRLKAAGVTGHLTSHCLRAGGITTALAKGVALRIAKRHGNWRSDAVYAYITESMANQLSVSMCC